VKRQLPSRTAGTRTPPRRPLRRRFATNPTGTGDADVLLLGDYNSYAMEDPKPSSRTPGT
jgi:predicted extracellular nuclease